MKLNFMMTIIAISFFALLSVMGAEYYTSHEAINAGLQQCKVGNEVIWQKVCL